MGVGVWKLTAHGTELSKFDGEEMMGGAPKKKDGTV